MADWYYYNNDKKVGPISVAALKTLVQKGLITRETVLESHTGRKIIAENVSGLTFPETLSLEATPSTPLSAGGDVYGFSSPQPPSPFDPLTSFHSLASDEGPFVVAGPPEVSWNTPVQTPKASRPKFTFMPIILDGIGLIIVLLLLGRAWAISSTHANQKLINEKQQVEEKEKAEEIRMAEEKQEEEKKRIADEERKAEEKRIVDEKRIAEEERKAEEKRIAEKKLAEEKRIAYEKQIAEEQRIADNKLEETVKPDLDRAVDLIAELKRSGFSELRDSSGRFERLKDFAGYGSSRLKAALEKVQNDSKASDRVKDVAKMNIRTQQTKIANMVFVAEYPYTISMPYSKDTAEIIIYTGFKSSKFEKVLFSVPDVTGKITDRKYSDDVQLAVSGNKESIGELESKKNEYRAKVWFKNLQAKGYSIYADIVKIEIISNQTTP